MTIIGNPTLKVEHTGQHGHRDTGNSLTPNPIHIARRTRQDGPVCVMSGSVNWISRKSGKVRTVIAKFHYTGPTGPDQKKSAHIVGDELNSTTRARPDPTGPARTFLRRNSVGSVRVSDKVQCGYVRVRAGPVGPVSGQCRARVVEFSY